MCSPYTEVVKKRRSIAKIEELLAEQDDNKNMKASCLYWQAA
jgi:hypothetical protein